MLLIWVVLCAALVILFQGRDNFKQALATKYTHYTVSFDAPGKNVRVMVPFSMTVSFTETFNPSMTNVAVYISSIMAEHGLTKFDVLKQNIEDGLRNSEHEVAGLVRELKEYIKGNPRREFLDKRKKNLNKKIAVRQHLKELKRLLDEGYTISGVAPERKPILM